MFELSSDILLDVNDELLIAFTHLTAIKVAASEILTTLTSIDFDFWSLNQFITLVLRAFIIRNQIL